MGISGRVWTSVIIAALVIGAQSATAAVLEIKTLSSRPDRVSGGDVLMQLVQSDDADLPVMLNGADVGKDFQPGSAPHTREGLVSGLKLGPNTIAAGGKTIKITNYPITGPIASGPHETPWICTTAIFLVFAGMQKPEPADIKGFGPALDKDCSAQTKITYLYMPKGGTAFKLMPSATSLPADVATTTTSTGATVNFVVRLETGTIDRGIYQSAILFDPTRDTAPSWRNSPKGWNRRLIAIDGHGCPGGWYIQGMEGGSSVNASIDASLLNAQKLGQGYGLFGNTLQNASQSCNPVLSGEAAMMGKEHFIKTYGVPAYTLSIGCSGGAYISNDMADALPGLFDGIMTACTFPDAFAIANSALDGHLLTHYFEKTAAGKFTEAQQVAVSGYKNKKAWVDAANQAQRTDPVPGRDDIKGYNSAVWSDLVPKALRYDPKTNPRGLRPTTFDVSRNVYGVDPKTGFALRSFDNVGVQYGLHALNSKLITPDQFLDLNQDIGGYDQDDNYVPNRVAGDAGAIKRAYQSGATLSGSGGLSQIPVFDLSGIYNDDSGYHYQWYHFAVRQRMIEANGDAKNHVMWRGNPVPLDKAWPAFITWVEAIHADKSSRSPRAKTIANRPVSLKDGCWKDKDSFISEPQTFSREPGTACNAAFPSYAFPRYVAGGPLAANIIKCQLRPVDAKDYQVSLTQDQMARLKRIFAGGVCDFSKPGVGQVKVVPWASFGPAPENLVYDVTHQEKL
jgi:hypothetical protein